MRNKENLGSTSREQFGSLAKQLERARKPDSIQAFSEGIVDAAVRDNYDCLNVLRGLKIAYSHMLPGQVKVIGTSEIPQSRDRNREGGLSVLLGIERYFNDVGITHKTLVPIDPSPKADPMFASSYKEDLKEIDEIATFINQAQKVVHGSEWYQREAKSRDLPQLLNIHTFFGGVKGFSDKGKRRGHDDVERDVLMIISNETSFRLVTEKRKALVEGYFDDIMESCNLPLFTHRVSKYKERSTLLEKIVSSGKTNFDPLPNIFTERFGEISLQDIYNFQLHDDKKGHVDPGELDRFGKMILEYVSSIPQGDFMWQRVLEDLFVVPSTGYELDKFNPSRKTKNFLKNVFYFQKWLTEKVFLPSLRGVNPNEEFTNQFPNWQEVDLDFDRFFGQVLSRIDASSAQGLSMSLMTGAALTTQTMKRYYPEISSDEILEQSPLVVLALSSEQGPIYYVNRLVQRFILKNWSILTGDLRGRFYTGVPRRRRDQLLGAIGYEASRDFSKQNTEKLINFFESLGGNFLEMLGQKEEQLREVTDEIWTDFPGWPHELLIHTLEYANSRPKSPDDVELEDMLGLVHTDFTLTSDMSIPVGFTIALKDQTVPLAGKIDSTGKVSWFLEENSLPSGLRALLDYIVVSGFKDLVTGNQGVEIREVHRGKSTRKNVKKESSEKIVGEGVPSDLSQKRVVYKYIKEGIKSIRAKELSTLVEQVTGKSPYYVGTHRMKLAGIDEYVRALVDFRHAGSLQRADREFALKEARKLMKQPNADKVYKQPLLVRLHPLLDPESDVANPIQLTDTKEGRVGVPLWENTWVQRFRVPPLDPDEKVSLAPRWRKRYKGRGPSRAFHQELLLWMKGLEGDQERIDEE